ncbi:MAG: ketoacyl-ACP synthase III [Rhabdochlamydiaceae bacterium]|nr:ketoacyl-ACP synthase III [Rhabdochlamydiaceae bacterium]
MQAKIRGTGSYLPEKILTNQDLEKMVETSDEWIVTRTGMKERRLARSDEFTSDMGRDAALKALEASGCPAGELDMILFATITPDYAFPSTACLIQKQIGAHKAAAMDIQAACTGFLYAMGIAKAFIESGVYKNILIVASEKLSSIVDYKDRNTCVLFGDGASAAVISSEGKGLLVRDVTLGADGEQAQLLVLPGGGSRNPSSEKTVADNLHYLRMEGKEVFKHAVRRMESASKESIEKSGLSESDISWFVPHQANLRIIESLAKRFNVPSEKVFVTIHKYGNTSASSLGIALDELLREKNIEAGENILLTAFGSGLTWGAAVLTHE